MGCLSQGRLLAFGEEEVSPGKYQTWRRKMAARTGWGQGGAGGWVTAERWGFLPRSSSWCHTQTCCHGTRPWVGWPEPASCQGPLKSWNKDSVLPMNSSQFSPQIVPWVEWLRQWLQASHVTAPSGECIDNGIHSLAVRVQCLSVGNKVGILSNFVQP